MGEAGTVPSFPSSPNRPSFPILGNSCRALKITEEKLNPPAESLWNSPGRWDLGGAGGAPFGTVWAGHQLRPFSASPAVVSVLSPPTLVPARRRAPLSAPLPKALDFLLGWLNIYVCVFFFFNERQDCWDLKKKKKGEGRGAGDRNGPHPKGPAPDDAEASTWGPSCLHATLSTDSTNFWGRTVFAHRAQRGRRSKGSLARAKTHNVASIARLLAPPQLTSESGVLGG